ncbi:MAG: methionyl-tRNA formyltransferase [Patescibacteria group bacterium]|nr:methionyl-tRNA formyltransferase [Patescibacteria group bacterium]MDE2590716.1 methionyl-tRNA formyltransferase [Patescibacteria group bacterium]
MQTVFFGSSRYVLPVIERLNVEFDLTLVITTEQKETDAVPAFCIEKNIPYMSVTSVKNETFIQELKKLVCPVAVLADFGLIVSNELINVFPKGIVNIHPSLLPQYRGPTPGQSAILSGKQETGVSVMLIDEQIDHGPLLAQEKTPIEPSDTADTLYARLFIIGSVLISNSLRSYLENTLTLIPQDDAAATFTKILTRQDGFIDSSFLPTHEKLQLMIRAYYPWPGVWTKLNLFGTEKIVKLLPNKILQVEGKKPMTAKDFLNGYPETRELLKKLNFLD